MILNYWNTIIYYYCLFFYYYYFFCSGEKIWSSIQDYGPNHYDRFYMRDLLEMVPRVRKVLETRMEYFGFLYCCFSYHWSMYVLLFILLLFCFNSIQEYFFCNTLITVFNYTEFSTSNIVCEYHFSSYDWLRYCNVV